MQEIIKYQEIDAEIRKMEDRLEGSENRKIAREKQDNLKEILKELEKIEKASLALSEQYRKATLLYNDFVQRLEKFEKELEKLEDKNIEGLKELALSYAAKAETLESQIEVLSKKIDAADKAWEKYMDSAKKTREVLDSYKASYAKEKAMMVPQIEKMKKELALQGEKIEPSLLAKYKSKSDSKNFPIIYPVNKGRCGFCRVEISASKLSDLSKKGIIECENCGRFVYKV